MTEYKEVDSPHKGQRRGALIFSLICIWTNGWANKREAGISRRQCTHYDVTVMELGIDIPYLILRAGDMGWGTGQLIKYDIPPTICTSFTTLWSGVWRLALINYAINGSGNGQPPLWLTPCYNLSQHRCILNWTVENKLKSESSKKKNIWKRCLQNVNHFVHVLLW